MEPEAPLPTFLRGLRVLHGVGQRVVSRSANVSPAYLSRIEGGGFPPSLSILMRWSSAFNQGRPDYTLWQTAIAAASATWPDHADYLTARVGPYSGDPDYVWSLTNRVTVFWSTVRTLDDVPYKDPIANRYIQLVYSAYPMATSKSVVHPDAERAVWFQWLWNGDPQLHSTADKHLTEFEAYDELDRTSASFLAAFLLDKAMRTRTTPPKVVERDPLVRDRDELWARIDPDAQKLVVELLRHLSGRPPAR